MDRNVAVIIGSAAAAAIAVGVAAGTWLYSHNHEQPHPAAAPETTVSATTTVSGTSQQTTPQQEARPRAQLPGDAEPVNDAARSQQPTGDFNNVYKSGPTSDDFALAVRDEWVRAYLQDRQLERDVVVFSPVTSLYYSMHCADRGGYVHCTGGDNANVYIA
ncbi:hypothetical protein ACUY3K_11185 [Corynebacterium uberis]|uniref:hypothetical protein n=1 Tax=Corynebacterium TaxID=1716 RepID=UPI001D0A6EEF|nr:MULTISPECIES: hypothetical protein [Corynebacterium]MCZ9310229.1 hypothetical protein [Corynebacterium sp. c6VSa_13]UDL75414.1 hypothetical protein LH393_09200 [Corynebacterium uberis]UDL77627.1 hypothetical protein LH394_09185 [Corynebacterium uberis]UDL79912.1 hypothetical protein LH392_09615 [Corynebacterium uberis]UDL82043.1 hypothetical protein LH395_09190 [Corynebacterium uberis]